MPQYLFRNDKSPHVEFWLDITIEQYAEILEKRGGKITRKSGIDGKKYTATAVAYEKDPGFTAIQSPATYPFKSDALGCAPSQAREFQELARAHGITGISYDHEGTCIVHDRSSRRKFMRLRGMHDRNGGYSDG